MKTFATKLAVLALTLTSGLSAHAASDGYAINRNIWMDKDIAEGAAYYQFEVEAVLASCQKYGNGGYSCVSGPKSPVSKGLMTLVPKAKADGTDPYNVTDNGTIRVSLGDTGSYAQLHLFMNNHAPGTENEQFILSASLEGYSAKGESLFELEQAGVSLTRRLSALNSITVQSDLFKTDNGHARVIYTVRLKK